MFAIPPGVIIQPANKIYVRVLPAEAHEFGLEMIKHMKDIHGLEPTSRKYTLGGVTFEYTSIQSVITDPDPDGEYCMVEIKYYNK